MPQLLFDSAKWHQIQMFFICGLSAIFEQVGRHQYKIPKLLAVHFQNTAYR